MRNAGCDCAGPLIRTSPYGTPREITFFNRDPDEHTDKRCLKRKRNVLPVDTSSVYIPLVKDLGYDPDGNSTDSDAPISIDKLA